MYSWERRYDRLNNGSQDVHVLILRTCECYLIWQRDLTGVIKDFKLGKLT